MVHAQSPWTTPPEQDFPIEVQFLGGLSDGNARPTGNVCSPGTHIVYRGEFTETHCIDSSSPTFDGDRWVVSETLVHGGVVSGHRPELKAEGRPLTAGFIALQSEGHPVQVRRVELLNHEGCMDPRFGLSLAVRWQSKPPEAAYTVMVLRYR